MNKYGLPKGVFEKKIFVKISKEDELTIANLSDLAPPKMVAQSMNLDFITDVKKYDPKERIKI